MSRLSRGQDRHVRGLACGKMVDRDMARVRRVTTWSLSTTDVWCLVNAEAGRGVR
jgi:hypothetical protein